MELLVNEKDNTISLLNKKIEMVSKDVTKIRDEIKLCNKIKIKVPVMKEELEKLNKPKSDGED